MRYLQKNSRGCGTSTFSSRFSSHQRIAFSPAPYFNPCVTVKGELEMCSRRAVMKRTATWVGKKVRKSRVYSQVLGITSSIEYL